MPKKIIKKKPAKKVVKVAKLKPVKPIGRVTHYYTNIKVAIVKFSKPPKIGSQIRFEGSTTSFSQPLASAQHDHKPVLRISKGKQVGIKVKSRVREYDSVYLVR